MNLLNFDTILTRSSCLDTADSRPDTRLGPHSSELECGGAKGELAAKCGPLMKTVSPRHFGPELGSVELGNVELGVGVHDFVF